MFYMNFLIFSIFFYKVFTLNIVNKTQAIDKESCRNLEFPINTEDDSDKVIVELLLVDNYLKIIPKIQYSESIIRIVNKQTNQIICSKSNSQHLFEINRNNNNNNNDDGQELLIEFQIEQDVRFLLLKLPKINETTILKNQEIFCYVDITDQNVIKLYIQPLPNFYNIDNYKIEVWREKNNIITLQDLRLIANNRDNNKISFHYFTYYEEGNYFFKISVINNECPEDFCLKTTTPKVNIERKSMSLVIGIVGASFILPFALFIFHILTKKYSSFKQQSTLLDTNRKILIIYQQSTQIHNNVVLTFGKFLEELFNINVLYDVIAKTKFLQQPEKLCKDTLLLTNDLIYITPPIYEHIQQLDCILINKRVCNLTFDYTTKTLPDLIQNYNCYKLFEQFDEFLNEFNLNSEFTYNKHEIYYELIEKIGLANDETRKILNSDLVPMIIVTDSNEHLDSFKD